jgi:hypothetical protein
MLTKLLPGASFPASAAPSAEARRSCWLVFATSPWPGGGDAGSAVRLRPAASCCVHNASTKDGTFSPSPPAMPCVGRLAVGASSMIEHASMQPCLRRPGATVLWGADGPTAVLLPPLSCRRVANGPLLGCCRCSLVVSWGRQPRKPVTQVLQCSSGSTLPLLSCSCTLCCRDLNACTLQQEDSLPVRWPDAHLSNERMGHNQGRLFTKWYLA